jgi:hypothetical protein
VFVVGQSTYKHYVLQRSSQGTTRKVCEEASKNINIANALKIHKAPSIQMKIQAIEGICDAQNWVNNMRVVVGKVTFKEAVKKDLSTTLI